MTLPKKIRDIKEKDIDSQKLALWEWLEEKNIECNLWYEEDKLTIKPTKQLTLPAKKPTTYYKIKSPTADSVDEAIDKLYDKQLQLEKNQMLIMHFRNATIGLTEENTQPIISGNFMVMHNGIFTKLGGLAKSDTRVFAEELNEEYRKEKITTKNEQEFLDKYIAKVDGWYSMFIYSWKTEKLYYYRQGASFYSSFNSILLSTKESRFPSVHKEVQSFVC